MKVMIEDIADKLDEVHEDWKIYINKKTGELVDISREYQAIAEELPIDEEIPAHLSEWEKEAVEAAIEIEEHWDDYEELPNQFDIDEYSIMEDFIDTITDNRKSNILYNAISGRGAFRRFKDEVFNIGLEEKWFSFKYKAFCKIAEEWCEDNDIAYEYREQKNK